MNDMEVWLLDDELEHSACEAVIAYTSRNLADVIIRQARDVAEFRDRISDYLSDQSQSFVFAFIDHWGPGRIRMALPALEDLNQQLGQERFMAVLMSDLDKPEPGLDSGELFKSWVDSGGHAYVAKKDITDPYLGKHYLAINFALASKMTALWKQAEELKREQVRQIEISRRKSKILGQSKSLEQAHVLIPKLAASNSNVLIRGESGTGKELVAKAIHYHELSLRKNKPFVAVNCAAVPKDLVESEFFGHEKGAFSGAHARKIGLLEYAEGGTLFLDEIGEFELALQAKLNRVLEERVFRRVGGVKDIPFDVRIISATLRDLEAEMGAERFRSDLFWRLSVFPIELPPLQERKEDIPLLIDHYLKFLNTTSKERRISQRAVELLSQYEWPGNIRELRNTIERVMILVDEDETIDVEHLSWVKKPTPVNRFDENDWSQLRAKIAARHPEGKCELVDKRVRNRIRLTEEETKRANAEGFDVVIAQVYGELLLEVLTKTGGSIGTITNLFVASERTIKDTLAEFAIEVHKKGARFVVVNRTAA